MHGRPLICGLVWVRQNHSVWVRRVHPRHGCDKLSITTSLRHVHDSRRVWQGHHASATREGSASLPRLPLCSVALSPTFPLICRFLPFLVGSAMLWPVAASFGIISTPVLHCPTARHTVLLAVNQQHFSAGVALFFCFESPPIKHIFCCLSLLYN